MIRKEVGTVPVGLPYSNERAIGKAIFDDDGSFRVMLDDPSHRELLKSMVLSGSLVELAVVYLAGNPAPPVVEKKEPEVRGVIAVVATDEDAGEKYAKALGLEDYRVITDYNQIQGLRTRALVVTPHYILEANKAHWRAMENFDRGMHEVIMSAGDYGHPA